MRKIIDCPLKLSDRAVCNAAIIICDCAVLRTFLTSFYDNCAAPNHQLRKLAETVVSTRRRYVAGEGQRAEQIQRQNEQIPHWTPSFVDLSIDSDLSSQSRAHLSPSGTEI